MNAFETNNGGLNQTFVIIPMLNEEASIELVLRDLPTVRRVFVIDNGSTDKGPEIAKHMGATVVQEPQRGYGKACLTGIELVDQHLADASESDVNSAIVAFLDADYSDHPQEIADLVRPIADGSVDFVIGSRIQGDREKGAMLFQAIFGNWLACFLMRIFWGARYSDLGPFRAIRYRSLKSLKMCDENFGWTIEMQIKAVQQNLRYQELPVSYRKRIGTSKISGTISGTFKAGYKILFTIFRYRFRNS